MVRNDLGIAADCIPLMVVIPWDGPRRVTWIIPICCLCNFPRIGRYPDLAPIHVRRDISGRAVPSSARTLP